LASSLILAAPQSEQSGTAGFPFKQYVRHQCGWTRGHKKHCIYLAYNRVGGEMEDTNNSRMFLCSKKKTS